MQSTQLTAERVKLQAKSQGVSAKKVLEICGLGPNTITKMSNGSDIVSQSLKRIADYLNCSVDYLLGRTDSPNGTYSINGNNNVQVNGNNGDNSPLSVNNSLQLDEMERNLIKTFRTLDFPQKIEIVSELMKQANKKTPSEDGKKE